MPFNVKLTDIFIIIGDFVLNFIFQAKEIVDQSAANIIIYAICPNEIQAGQKRMGAFLNLSFNHFLDKIT